MFKRYLKDNTKICFKSFEFSLRFNFVKAIFKRLRKDLFKIIRTLFRV